MNEKKINSLIQRAEGYEEFVNKFKWLINLRKDLKLQR